MKLNIRQYVVLTNLTVRVHKVHCAKYLLNHIKNMNMTQSNKINIYHCKLNLSDKIKHVRSCLFSNLQFGSYCIIQIVNI